MLLIWLGLPEALGRAVGAQPPQGHSRCPEEQCCHVFRTTWGWSHSGEEGCEAAPWSVDFDVDLLKRTDMACA
jgi:hypothetical protein